MMFLIGKIFIYLFLAAGIGAAAGWLMRNLQAQKAEESAFRGMNDAKAKLPQIESLLRGRDEQITKLKDQLIESKSRVSEHDQNLREVEQKLRDQERLTKRWQQSAEAKNLHAGDDFDLDGEEDQTDPNNLIAELSQEIENLKAQLERAQVQTPAQPGETVDEALLEVEMDALRAQITDLERRLAVITKDLAEEQNKVRELERERELQTKSLQVLHQQLELERTRRVANG